VVKCEPPYFHVVFTLPEQIAELAFYNQEAMYGMLFRAASQTLLTPGADPQHLGAQLGFFAILHTWGQNLLFHPHLHIVVPGGGLSADHERFVACRQRRFFLPVKVLSSLFRRLFLEALEDAFYQKRLQFPGSVEHLQDAGLFHNYLYALEKRDWVVYAQPPFGGPEQVLRYLGRYTHRVAISNCEVNHTFSTKIISLTINHLTPTIRPPRTPLLLSCSHMNLSITGVAEPRALKLMGRPPFNPSDEDRTKIVRMCRLGIPRKHIAIVFGISPKTLSRHCRKELDQAIEANVKVAATLFTMATSGKNVAATIFWAKTRCGFKYGGSPLQDLGFDESETPDGDLDVD
jgi:hypothetical protein